MKKFLIISLLTLCACVTNAQSIQWFRTTQFAIATINPYTERYTWGNWESSNVKICINLVNDIITIYSPTIQRYAVYATANNGKSYYDNSGGENVKFYAIDQDGDKCEIRLRMERNGNSQIYIDFSNLAWCYNVVRTN